MAAVFRHSGAFECFWPRPELIGFIQCPLYPARLRPSAMLWLRVASPAALPQNKNWKVIQKNSSVIQSGAAAGNGVCGLESYADCASHICRTGRRRRLEGRNRPLLKHFHPISKLTRTRLPFDLIILIDYSGFS